VVVNDLTSSITGSGRAAVIAALVVMALTLGVVFRSRRGCCRCSSRSPRRA